MTLEETIAILQAHNRWRRHNGEPMPMPHSPKELGQAIDTAINILTQIKDRRK